MSVTTLENDYKRLISHVDINFERVSRKSSRCSCSDCNSVSCFAKRNKVVKGQCQCINCKDLKNCCSELLEKEIETKTLVEVKDSIPNKVIREIVKRETIESVKKVTETMFGYDNKDDFEATLERPPKISKESDKIINKNSEIKKKSISHREDDTEKTVRKECCIEKTAIQVPSVYIDFPPENNDTVTKLSAQVMDVPFKDLEVSASANETLVCRPPSTLNVFKRIKEIYDACSCKVCECIPTKPLFSLNEVCNCKPCDCSDCVNIRSEIENNIKQIPPSGCPCVACDRKDCRGIVKNATESQPCDCDVSEPCNCEPCQCINCKSLNSGATKTVKIAQFDEIFHTEVCHCSPCDCIECKQMYNRLNPIVMCSNPTDKKVFSDCRCEKCLNEQCQFDEEENCTCEMHNRIVTKTFQKSCNDYDVHSVIVDSTGSISQQSHSIFDNHNTIALFATLKNNNPTHLNNKSPCKCIECECLVCNAKEEKLISEPTTLLKPKVRHSGKPSALPVPITNACKCSPCECEICSRKSREDSATIQSKCKCDICDCLNCDNASFQRSSATTKKLAKPIKNISANNNCTCHPCECDNCNTFLSCTNHSTVKFYSGSNNNGGKSTRRLRKVMLISPCTSESNLNTQKIYNETVWASSMSIKGSMKDVHHQNHSTWSSVVRNSDVPQVQLMNNETEHNSKLNINSKYNDSIYIGLERDNLLNLNDPDLKTKSCSSIKEEPTFGQHNDFNVVNIKTHRTAENNENIQSEVNSLNYIHKSPIQMYSRNSDDSVTMFWIRPDETTRCGAFSQNVKSNCTVLPSAPVNDFKRRFTNTSHLKNSMEPSSYIRNKQVDSCEKFRNTETKQSVLDTGNTFYKCFGRSKYDRNAGCDVNNTAHNVLSLEANNYKDTVCTSMKNNNINFMSHSELTISYENATKVLKEAKAFSSKLVKMLDSFETANKKFESASLKFKNLHNSLLDININHNISSRVTLNIPEKHYEPVDTKKNIVKDENEAEKEYEQSIDTIKISNNLKQNQDTKSLGILGMKNVSEAFSKSDNLNVTGNELGKNPARISELSVKKESRSIHKLENTTSRKSTKILLQTNTASPFHIPNPTDFEEKSFTQSRFAGEATDKNPFNTETLHLKNTIISKEQEQEVLSLNKKLASIFDNKAVVDDAVTTETQKDCKEYPERCDRKSWDILRKNLDLGDLLAKRKTRITGPPALELDVKETIEAITLQAKNQEKLSKPVPRVNEALAHLLIEVSNLLSMPSLQPNSQVKNETDIKVDSKLKSLCSTASSQTYDNVIAKADKFQNDFYRFSKCNGIYQREFYSGFEPKVKSTSSSKKMNEDDDSSNISTYKSSCEDFKASFVGLRRVSDHTVLVKWNVPKRVKDIQGYELLVDGRAVQTILRPARRAALLSGLPRGARVLLTVRTLAAACGHAPAASVVYRPGLA